MLEKLLVDERIPLEKRKVLKYVVNSLSPLSFELTKDTLNAADSLEVPELYDFNHGLKKKKKEYKGFLKDLRNNFYNELKSIIVFGSLAQGYYWRSKELIEKCEPDEDASHEKKILFYSTVLDLFNYPRMSDVDLCLVGSDDLNSSEVKKELSKSSFYFEHASIISKKDFTDCLKDFYKYTKKDKGNAPTNFEVILFEHEEDEKVRELRKKLESLRTEKYNTMIDYSLKRLDNNINRDEIVFSQATVIKALHQSFIINFDPMIGEVYLPTINEYYNNISGDYKSFVNNFFYERAVNDMLSSERIDKWHFLKRYRKSILNNLKNL